MLLIVVSRSGVDDRTREVPFVEPDPHPPPDGGLGLPGPPTSRVPWLDELRSRVGLDGRAVAWTVGAVVALLCGGWLLRPAGASVEEALPMASTSSTPAPGEAVPGGASSSTSSTAAVPVEVVVHAAGAVARPGVYTLPATARVDDLVGAAGGLAPDADASRLNLAAPLSDGARVYVPRVGEADAPEVVDPDGGPAPPAGPSASGEQPQAGPVDLNVATEAELDALPGVGPAIAAAIVAFREENGGFASVDDLLDVRGIGDAKMAELRPLVTV